MREPITLSLCLAIAAGGAFGAVLRFMVTNAVSRYLPHQIFPLDTIVVNMLGALVLGSLLELMTARWQISLELRGFILFGVIGGFTTFSRFAMDIINITERQEMIKALIYIIVSVVSSVLCAYGAMRIVRGLIAV